MQIPVVIDGSQESLSSQERDRAVFAVEGESAEESLRLWRERFSSVLPADAEVVRVNRPSERASVGSICGRLEGRSAVR